MLDGHTAIVWQGGIFVWGGKDESTATANRPAQSYYNSTMYMIDALDVIQPNSVAVSMHRVPVTSSEGSLGVVHPRGRAYHTSSLYGKHMFVVGGLMDESSTQASGQQNESNNNVVMPVFDLEARSWSFRNTFGDVPCARCHHVSVVYGDTIMVHGGYPIVSGQQKELTAEEMSSMQHTMFDVHELNITTLRWRRINTAQSPSLWGHSAVAFNKNVIVFGGVDVVENTETGAVAVWHQEKKLWRWADFQNLDLKCAMHTAALDGSRMLIFGGVSFKNQKKLRSLYEFNLEFGTWRELNPRGQMPEGRIGHAAITFQQNMIVIGGSVEGDSGGDGTLASSTARFDRKIYVFNSQTNDWRSMQISVNATGDMGDTRAGSITGASSTQTPGQQRLNPTNAAWSINKSRNQTGEDTDWDATANRVRDTLTRAKAIQQLADTAADALSHQQQYDDHSGQQQPQQSGGAQASLQRLQRQTDPNVSYEYSGGGGGGATFQQQDPDTRRMMEHLKRENELLRKQLEEFRSISLNQGTVNPYEVPVYNTAAGVVPENESLASPGRSRGHSRLEGNAALTELAPRLNINVAEPPRSVGGHHTGYMSRSAISALVNSSLRDQPASTSLAANLRAAASMDPMSYLTQTPHVAAFQKNASSFGNAVPGSYQAPRTYEELLGRRSGQGPSDPNSFATMQASATRNEGMPPVPNSLKPLLAILTGGSIPGTAIPAQFAMPSEYSAPSGAYAYGGGYDGVMNSAYHHNAPSSAPPVQHYPTPYPAQPHAEHQHDTGRAAVSPAPSRRNGGNPTSSLSQLVNGKGSMLSLTMLQ